MFHTERIEVKFEEEYASNEDGVFIFDVQDPLDESWKYRDTTRAYGTLGRLKNHSQTCAPRWQEYMGI